MFTVLILICAIHVTPPDYQIETASAVLQGPEAANEVLCGLHGQAYVASSALAGPRKGRYLKIKCRRAPTERSKRLNSEAAS